MLFSVILVVVPTERRQRFDSMKCPFARCSRLFRKQDRLWPKQYRRTTTPGPIFDSDP